MATTQNLTVRFLGDAKPLRKSLLSVKNMLAGGAVALGALAVGGIQKAISASIGFEKQMALVRGMLGDISETDFNKVKQQTRSLAKEFGLAHEDAGKIMYQLASQEVPTEQIDKYGKAIAGLSKAMNTDAESAGAALLRPMEAFGKTADDLEHVKDVMAGMVQMGQMTGEQMAQYFPTFSAEAASMGVTMEEVGSAFANATKQMQPDRAATALRGLLNTIAKGNETLDQFGASDLIKEHGLIEGVKRLVTMAKGSPKILNQMFPEMRAKSFALTIGNLYGKMVDGKKRLMSDDQSFERMLNPIMDSQAAKWDIFKAQITDLGVTLGDQLLQPISSITAELNRFLESANGMQMMKDQGQILANTLWGAAKVIKVIWTMMSGVYALFQAIIDKIMKMPGMQKMLQAMYGGSQSKAFGQSLNISDGEVQQGKRRRYEMLKSKYGAYDRRTQQALKQAGPEAMGLTKEQGQEMIQHLRMINGNTGAEVPL